MQSNTSITNITSSNREESAQNPATSGSVGIGRKSSIRFSADTNTSSRSSMATRRGRTSSEDEILPIRQSDNHADRNYNTAEVPQSSYQNNSSPKAAAPKPRVNGEDDLEDDKAPWYRRIVDKYGSVSLENKGSVARDHLALERTFLAWLRTSLAFASIGIAVTQLFRLNTSIAKKNQQGQNMSPVPLSPLLGQAIPADLIPYLQQALSTSIPNLADLGPTLLDQLLMLGPDGRSLVANTQSGLVDGSYPISPDAYDDKAAARLRHVGKPLGATFLGISILVLLVGFHRYFESQYWIIRNKFPASRGSIFLVGFIAAALIIASMVVVLTVAQSSYEK